MGFLRIIGSKVIVLHKSRWRKEFDLKGLEYILTRTNQKPIILWRRGTKTIIKARDVKFFEKTNEETTSDAFINLDIGNPDEENSNKKKSR